MTLYLSKELETEVEGHGDGFISIKQIDECANESIVWLSINQFQQIFNFEKKIIDEALDVNLIKTDL